MKTTSRSLLHASLAIGLALPAIANPSEEHDAKQMCKDQIEKVAKVESFQHVWADKIGNHKYRVHGSVLPGDGHRWDFNCKIKQGQVKSYGYDGPVRHHHDKDDDDGNLATVLAVGAGLAIVAALASADDDDSKSDNRSPQKSILEDDCLEQLQYRVRDEHHHSSRVTLNNSRIDGHDLVGEANVRYDHRGHAATYTCHFDRNWRLRDSSYYLY